MKRESEFSDFFDEDFEVTYEDDAYSMDTDEKMPRTRRTPHYRAADSDPEEWDTSEENDIDGDTDYDFPDYDDKNHSPRSGGGKQKKSRKKRRSRGVPLAAPIRKGGRTLSRLASALVRSMTAVLILATTAYVMWTFWRASTPYGDIMEALETMKPSVTLIVYVCAAVLFLLFELISLLWSMTRTRVRNGMDTWKEDTGRGLTSFIIVFAISYLSFLFSPFLPDAPEAVYGLKGALDVYGSMHNVLFGLCAAGVASCIVRKYFG